MRPQPTEPAARAISLGPGCSTRSASSCWSRSSGWLRCCWPPWRSGGCRGRGSGSPKPLGLLLVTWAWMAASVTLVRYGTGAVIGAVLLLAIAGALVAARQRPGGSAGRARGGWWARRRAEWAAARALPSDDPVRRPLWLGPEVVFAVSFAAMALLVAYSPDVGDGEADGHGVRERGERSWTVPAARPVDGGRGPQLLLPRSPRDGDRDQGRRDAARRGLQPRAGAARGAVGDRRVRVRGDAVGGCAAAATSPCAAARWWSA